LFLFVFGVAGATYEVVTYAEPGTTVMIFFGTCMGLPAFLPDGLFRKRDGEK
jgi:hypothetical protein